MITVASVYRVRKVFRKNSKTVSTTNAETKQTIKSII